MDSLVEVVAVLGVLGSLVSLGAYAIVAMVILRAAPKRPRAAVDDAAVRRFDVVRRLLIVPARRHVTLPVLSSRRMRSGVPAHRAQKESDSGQLYK